MYSPEKNPLRFQNFGKVVNSYVINCTCSAVSVKHPLGIKNIFSDKTRCLLCNAKSGSFSKNLIQLSQSTDRADPVGVGPPKN